MYEEPRYQYTGTKRFFFVVGAACMLAGICLVGVAGYVIFLQPADEKQWIYVIPGRPEVSPAVVGAVSAPSAPLVNQKYNLVIEKLGVDAPVGVFGVDENNVPEVPYDRDTVAWYDFSAEPGAGGNAVFAGHYTWRGDAVFRHLGDLQNGDRVILRGEGGLQLEYQVFHTELIDPSDATAATWMLPTDFDVVTLITCGGERTITNDPIFGAEYDKRQVVRAALVRDDGSAPQPGG